jgi:hypothetical protein
MKAMLRRAHLRLDVTTATGERKTLTLGARPDEPGFSGLLARLVVGVMAEQGFELVDEQEQPFEASLSETASPPVVVVPPLVDPEVNSALTEVVHVVGPDIHSPPPAPAATSPSVVVAPTGDLAPVLRRRRAFGNDARQQAPAVVHPTKHVVTDAHARIAPTRTETPSVVIGPRDVQPVGPQRVQGATHVVGQAQHVAPAVVIRPDGMISQARPPAAVPDAASPVVRRKRGGA